MLSILVLDPSGALQELRGSVSYFEECSTVAPYVSGMVALPSKDCSPQPLVGLLGQTDFQRILELSRSNIAVSDVSSQLSDLGLKKPYVDPEFKNYDVYLNFVKELSARGLASFHLSSFVREFTGTFFVKKKDGRLRLVLDARRSNCHFVTPPATDLATGASIGDIQCDRSRSVYVGHVDISNAFYTLALPIEWRRYFALPGVKAGDVGVPEVTGRPVPPSTIIYPCISVVPMGWSHATFWCQSVLRSSVSSTGLCPDEFYMYDASVSPPSVIDNIVWTVYFDNFLVFGHSNGESHFARSR